MAFKIIRNNIINVSADAIVNTANPKPAYASGVDSAIYKAAGARKLLKERKKIGDIEPGCAVSTPAFKLSAKYIIHTVGPEWQGGDAGERETVKNCYVNSLNLAKELGCESIAFPLIATGVYGFPKEDALRIAINVFSDFLIDSDMEITLVVFDEKSFVLSDKIFAGVETYIDDNYVTQKVYEEYETEDETRTLLGDIPYRSGSRRFGSASRAKESSQGSFPMYASRSASMSESVLPQEDKAVHMSLDDKVAHIKDTWQESLFHLIDERGYTDIEVYKRANVDRKLFSKIRSNAAYQPKKVTALAFALALRLNLDETKDFLSRAGYALSPSSMFDLIVEYFIEQEVYDIYTINLALFKHEQQLLGE
ncbi:MAG: macro domain-containing protein [Lachnospiraceae bacterium]|nr:macro domain-containing protein [Lachnospiraceae bacterium]